MKKHILALIFLLACALPTLAQTGVQYQGTVNTKVINRGLTGADSGLVITPSDTFNKSLPVGTIRFLTDLSGYVFTGSYWKYINAPNLAPYMRYTDTASLSTRINAKQATLVSGTNIKTINGTSLLGSGDISISGGGGETDTTYLSSRIDARVKYSDTATMLTNYARKSLLADTAAAIRSAIPSVSGKVNYTDTATMLTNYARKSLLADTAAAIRSDIPSVSGKVNYTDTAAMLANYARKNLLADTAAAIQTRLNLKLNIANPTATGTLTAPNVTISSLSSGTTNDSLLVADPSTGAVKRISSSRISSGGGGGSGWGLSGNAIASGDFIGGTSANTNPLIFKWNGLNSGFINGANISYGTGAYSGTSNGTFIGYNAGRDNGQVQNTAIGYEALKGNVVGANNVVAGHQALSSGTNVNGWVVAGFQAVPSATGNSGIAIGSDAGYSITSGNKNLVIAFQGTVPTPTASNQVNLGNALWGSDCSATGTTAAGRLSIGTNTPNPRSLLELSNSGATKGGFKLPALTTSERDAISWVSGDAGMMIWNSTLTKAQVWTGSAWADLH